MFCEICASSTHVRLTVLALKVAMLRNPLGKATMMGPPAPHHRDSGPQGPRPALYHVVSGCLCRAPQAKHDFFLWGNLGTRRFLEDYEKWRLQYELIRNRNEIQKLEADFRRFAIFPPGPVSLDLFCTRLPGQGPAGSDQCLLALKEDPEQVLATVPVSADASPPLGPHSVEGRPARSLRSRSSVSEVVEAYDELVEVALLVSNATGEKTKCHCLEHREIKRLVTGFDIAAVF